MLSYNKQRVYPIYILVTRFVLWIDLRDSIASCVKICDYMYHVCGSESQLLQIKTALLFVWFVLFNSNYLNSFIALIMNEDLTILYSYGILFGVKKWTTWFSYSDQFVAIRILVEWLSNRCLYKMICLYSCTFL